jgi:hypothetical protein
MCAGEASIMVRHANRKHIEREYQNAHPGMTLTEAKHHIQHARDAGVVVGDVPLAELGVTVLPPDATAAQRARAEAIWRPADADEPCRCSGTCHHGSPCVDSEPDDPCAGRMVHTDRYPGGMFHLRAWFDEYGCDTCGAVGSSTVELPNLPWGEAASENGILVYEGVRHPNFRDEDDEDTADEGCFECGARPGYRCTCDDPDEPWCEDCGASIDYECTCG